MRHFLTAAVIAMMSVGLTATVSAQPVETAPDDTWVTVTGTVVSTTPSSFRLDYGDGIMTIEMDDFDSYGDVQGVLENDQVIVSGVVDDDLFEQRTIEASSVFVENLGTYFYANPADEEGLYAWSIPTEIVVGDLEVTGTVTAIDGREMTIAFGPHLISVDTIELSYNPLDDRGFQQIDIGDRVKVAGNIDDDLFDEPELNAEWIVNLSQS